MNNPHTCQAVGCDAWVPHESMLCRDHLHDVPKRLRIVLYALSRLERDRPHHSEGYEVVLREAVNALARASGLEPLPSLLRELTIRRGNDVSQLSDEDLVDAMIEAFHTRGRM